jgi:hypothetical protein
MKLSSAITIVVGTHLTIDLGSRDTVMWAWAGTVPVRVTLLGVRGSIPTPGPRFVRYGQVVGLEPGWFEAAGFRVLAAEIPHKGGRTFGYRIHHDPGRDDGALDAIAAAVADEPGVSIAVEGEVIDL